MSAPWFELVTDGRPSAVSGRVVAVIEDNGDGTTRAVLIGGRNVTIMKPYETVLDLLSVQAGTDEPLLIKVYQDDEIIVRNVSKGG